MEKKITGYTTVDISQWHRKEHFEAFQSVAQCTYNQTVQLDITAFLKTVKKNKHKFYPAFIHILARLMNAHPEFRMAMKDGELVIWDSVHPCYTVFHEQTETFSSLWSDTTTISGSFYTYIRKMWRVTVKTWPISLKGLLRICFSSQPIPG